MPDLRCGFYNVGPSRDHGAVATELASILHTEALDFFGLAEAIGYPLPKVVGYQLLRDTTRPGRANIAAYVRVDAKHEEPTNLRWVDLEKTWHRTHGPGQHPARSILVFRYCGIKMLVAHTPPITHANESGPARVEHVARLQGLLTAKKRPELLVLDANAANDDKLGMAALAKAIGGVVADRTRIDTAVARRGTFTKVRYITSVAGHPLGSDHHHAVMFGFRPSV